MNTSQRYEFLKTSSALLDGTLEQSAPEVAQFARDLVDDPEAFLLLSEFVALDVELQWSSGARAEQDFLALGLPTTFAPLEIASTTRTPAESTRLRSSSAAIRASTPLLRMGPTSRFIGLAASLFLVCYFASVAALLIWDRAHRADDHRQLAAERSNEDFARLTHADDSSWDQPLNTAGDQPKTLRVRTGLAELKFAKGATVVVEGPAEFEVRSADGGFLQAGKLIAHVPQQAVGFKVETPAATVVDLGTEFGVEVDKSGTTEVAVFAGKVELHPAIDRSRPSSTSQPIILTAGAARRIEVSTTGGAPTIHEIAHTPGRFKLRADSTTRTRLFNSVGINRAATAWATSVDDGPVSAINDQVYHSQYDSGSGDTSAVAISFDSDKTFHKIALYLTPGWVIRGFDVQVAKPGLRWPDVNNNDNWLTISGGSFTSQASDGQHAFTFDQSFVSSGVRIIATDKSNIADGRMRIRDLMVFDRYQNIAPRATISTGNDVWAAGTAPFNDELISNQTFIDCSIPRIVDFTWATPQTIGSFMLFGGSGHEMEVLKDFTIQADLGSGLQTLFTHTGNTAKVTNDILANAISTTHVRLTITSAIPDNWARVSEFYIFAPCEQGSSQKP